MTREDAIKKVRWQLFGLIMDKDVRDAFETLIPELAESEDERTRKEIIEYLKLHDKGEDDYAHAMFCRWFAYLENQKEQKPNIELIQRSWYMEGYHDREFGKEPKWILKTGEGGPKHELNPRYGQPLAKQQPTEEQMHDLNEAIKSFRMDGCERLADSLHSLYIFLKSAYHYPTQVQKPAQWSEEDEKFVRGLIRGLTAKRDIFGRTTFSSDNLDITETINWLKFLPEKFALPPKQEWTEEDERMRQTAIESCKTTAKDYVRSSGRFNKCIDWLNDRINSRG